MEIIIIQHGEDVGSKAREMIEEEIATAQVKIVNANDPFDSLAHAKKHLDKGKRVMLFVELEAGDEEIKNGFYQGLARLQVDTGETLYKEIYTTSQKPETEKTVEKFIENAV